MPTWLIWTLGLGIPLAAAAVPVIIHLINLTRYRKVDWAAMEFLLRAYQKTRRKMQVESLIMLLLRVAAVILIAMALFPMGCERVSAWAGDELGLSSGGLNTDAPLHLVLVLDNSASMSIGLKAEYARTLVQLLSYVAQRDAPTQVHLLGGGSSRQLQGPAGMRETWRFVEEAPVVTGEKAGALAALKRFAVGLPSQRGSGLALVVSDKPRAAGLARARAAGIATAVVGKLGDLFGRMSPPDVSGWREIGAALVETVHIATLATVLALVLALPTAYIAAQNTTPNRALKPVGAGAVGDLVQRDLPGLPACEGGGMVTRFQPQEAIGR